MKSLALSGVALLALMATPALAQNAPIGSVGVTAVSVEADFDGEEVEADGGLVDGSVAGPIFGSWTVTIGASVAWQDGSIDEDKNVTGQVHLTRLFGDMRAGGFVAATDVDGETLTTVGLELQKYFDQATVTGSISYGSFDQADVLTAGVDGAFYPTANLRLNAGASRNTVEGGGLDIEGYSLGAGAEYQFAGTPLSLFAGYDRTTIDDFDLDIDTVALGVRFNFGGGVQERDRSGANLGRSVGGLVSALNGL